ncbi:MAG TPA: hypothetical protein VE954_19455 [Oligoflexus sp.]|uniref:hypothetical protein n=1 Tax=Oligoflexus sp. TaxID=1971216 RepID=UPI002D7394AF|nr:hypothetical protein [Oligoflexus sp.]HYX35279.1 hypothetical protein [Oligoflexus sp.]
MKTGSGNQAFLPPRLRLRVQGSRACFLWDWANGQYLLCNEDDQPLQIILKPAQTFIGILLKEGIIVQSPCKRSLLGLSHTPRLYAVLLQKSPAFAKRDSKGADGADGGGWQSKLKRILNGFTAVHRVNSPSTS